MSGWSWTCTGGQSVFWGADKQEAQGKFFDHVKTAHPSAIVVSIPPEVSP